MNKIIGTIVAVVAIIVVVTGLTFAWYDWATTSDQQTAIDFTVSGVSDCVTTGTPTFTGTPGLIPTANPTNDNSYTGSVTITETCTPELYATIELTPTALPNDLISTAFEWELTATPTVGEPTVFSGDFSGKTQGVKFTLNDETYIHTGEVTYSLQVWLDGENSINTMQGETYTLGVNINLTDQAPV